MLAAAFLGSADRPIGIGNVRACRLAVAGGQRLLHSSKLDVQIMAHTGGDIAPALREGRVLLLQR